MLVDLFIATNYINNLMSNFMKYIQRSICVIIIIHLNKQSSISATQRILTSVSKVKTSIKGQFFNTHFSLRLVKQTYFKLNNKNATVKI